MALPSTGFIAIKEEDAERQSPIITWLRWGRIRASAPESEFGSELPLDLGVLGGISFISEPEGRVEYTSPHNPFEKHGRHPAMVRTPDDDFIDCLTPYMQAWEITCRMHYWQRPLGSSDSRFMCNLTKTTPRVPVMLNRRLYDLDALITHIEAWYRDPVEPHKLVYLFMIEPAHQMSSYLERALEQFETKHRHYP